MTISPVLTIICHLCLVGMFATVGMCLYRIVIGPGAADLAVALDLLSVAFIGIICIVCMMWGNSWYFDAVWILTLVGFLGSAAIARYLEKGKVF